MTFDLSAEAVCKNHFSNNIQTLQMCIILLRKVTKQDKKKHHGIGVQL